MNIPRRGAVAAAGGSADGDALAELQKLHGAEELPDTGIEVCETCLVLHPCRTAELLDELAR